ncbi:hypothetical protein [Dubosiella newyorkensis]|uniref:hypothetical protein n=1 Tax=Dubosiella newyorkensis TaxID=1862672 RepID=UPI00272E91C7|nr:hypothetical protein [Dubosiella newyorkensis]
MKKLFSSSESSLDKDFNEFKEKYLSEEHIGEIFKALPDDVKNFEIDDPNDYSGLASAIFNFDFAIFTKVLEDYHKWSKS